VLICTLLPGIAVYAQAPTPQVWIAGDITVSTSDSLTVTVVRVKGRMYRDSSRSGEHDVVFCMTHLTPLAAKLNYTGRGRVVYRMAGSGKPTKNGARAEEMMPALGVLQADGESRFFLGEGQPYPHPPNERTVGKLSTFAVVNIVRHDVGDPSNRQKTDALSCVESKR